jgi:uncharacterized protein
MRRAEKEITDPQEIDAILAEATVCRIAMIDAGTPYVVPVCFGYEAGALYIHSASRGRKIEALRKNPLVCFEMDTSEEPVTSPTPCRWGMRYRSIIGFGKATFILQSEEKTAALNCIMKHYTGRGGFMFPEEELSGVCVVKVSIDHLTGKKSGY